MATSDGTVELAGSARPPPAGARRLGPSDPTEVAEITLVLRRRGPRPTPAPPGVSAPLRDGFADRFGYDPADAARVRAFATAHGLTVVADRPERRTVHVRGTVGRLADAFGVALERFDTPTGAVRGRSGPVRVPAAIADVLVAVLGLDNRRQAKSHVRPLPAAATGVAYSTNQIAVAYDFPAGADGSGECIGLIELGGGYRSADLEQFFQGIPIPTPSVTAVSVDGATNAPTGDPNGPDAEVELDLEVAGGLAPGAAFAVYFAPNTDQGFVDAVGAAVHDTTNRPTIVSISWGGPESTWTAQARAAMDAVLEDAASLGVTVLVAAGDDGADDGGPGTGLAVDYPASSPLVVACGGTHLVLSGGEIVEEVVWNDLAEGEGATGGGVSVDYALPNYQEGFDVPAAPNGFVGRGVPDVTGDADPLTGYRVVVDGSATVLGGTSAVAPLWAALFARVNQLLGAPVGYVTPHLYADATTGAFHDITSGGNGGYTAGPGWDACSGLGSPEGTSLADVLRGT